MLWLPWGSCRLLGADGMQRGARGRVTVESQGRQGPWQAGGVVAGLSLGQDRRVLLGLLDCTVQPDTKECYGHL